MKTYGAETTTDEVLEGVNLQGRHFMVTGASSGLGEETVRALSNAGATVTMVARNSDKLDSAAGRIKASVPNADLQKGLVDLADLSSIRTYAENFLQDQAPIDVLINNAGVMACPFMTTKDGFEMQFGTNHLGHFLLTNLLMPAIQSGQNQGLLIFLQRVILMQMSIWTIRILKQVNTTRGSHTAEVKALISISLVNSSDAMEITFKASLCTQA